MRHPFRTTRRDDGLTVSPLVETQLPPAPPTARRPVLIRLATSLLLVAVVAAFLAGVATNHLQGLLPPSPSTTPIRGGSIVDGVGFEPNSFLPWRTGDAIATQAIWAPLWYGDPQGAFDAGLAQEVPSSTNGGISADLTTWTIHLRSGLKWSDGSPLTAADCAFSFNLYADPAFEAGFPSTDPSDPVGFVGATAIDATTFVIQLRHPLVLMLSWLSDGWSTCVPREVFSKMTAAQGATSHENFQPSVVSGPFRVKEHIQGDHLTLVRNPYYYQGPEKPYLDQITFKFVRGVDAALPALQTHAIDTYWDLDFTKLANYRAIGGYTTYLDPYSAWYELLAFNLTDPILSDHAVRQAITMSIDRTKIIQTALDGAGSLICDDGVGTFSHEPNLTCYPFDPSAADVLLDGDGWTMGADGYRHKNGQTLELEYATTAKPWRAVTQTLIRDQLKAIGIKIDLKVYAQQDDFFGSNSGTPGALAEGHFQIAEFANNNNYEPSDYNLFKSIASRDPGNANWMHYDNPEVDQLLDSQAATADFTVRKADFHTIHGDVLKDLPVMYLHSPLDISCARSDLHNYDPSPEGATETWNIWDWWLGAKGS